MPLARRRRVLLASGGLPDGVNPLERVDLAEVAKALGGLGADGWLIYDFHGLNPVAKRLLALSGLGTRRLFVWIPAQGRPVAVAHRIELQPLAKFPGEVRPYAAWKELHAELERLVRGKRIAIEYSPDDAVPYLDRVPAGVVELLRRLGATVLSSASLVTRFAAGWSAAELADHRRAAEHLARIARETLDRLVRERPEVTEFAVQQDVLAQLARAGLVTKDPPIVAFGPNAANPHYEPAASGSGRLGDGQVVLLDLWAGCSATTVFADQTWMGFTGSVPEDVRQVWEAVRDAREAAVNLLRDAHRAGRTLAGRDLDAVARAHIERKGFGAAFVHRTGHSIDIDLHGSGPHLDSFETDDDRQLLPGVGFSVEPGVYLAGRFGVRSEINVYLAEDGPQVTPVRPQGDLITA